MNITNELREKLLTADSAEKVAELLKADGQEVEPDDVEKLWAVCGQQMAHIDGTITRKSQCRNGHISLRGF